MRDAPGAAPHVVLGMPAQQLDLQAFVQFVLDCTLDNRLTADAVRGRLPKSGGPSLFERALLRAGLVDRLKIQTLNLRNRIAPILADGVPRWGRGRVDTFNPYKAVQFNWDLSQLPAGELIGASDYPSLWNQAPREGMHLHWDGDNDSVDERNLSAALGAGVTPVTVDHDSAEARARLDLDAGAAEIPLRHRPGAGRARGAALCAALRRMPRRPPLPRRREGRLARRPGRADDRIGTDRHRLDSYTFAFASNQVGLYPDSEYRFTHFRKTNGYANQPLDGIWLRGPYLHNGSVPTLRDLLEPPDQRPKAFYRGNDLYDPQKVGFVSDVATAGRQVFTRYDTSVPGNSNSGHLYGTQLSDDEKRAVVEYMKAF